MRPLSEIRQNAEEAHLTGRLGLTSYSLLFDVPALCNEVERLRAIINAFVEHHDNGQSGQPGHPKTYGEEDVWQAEWDRRYAALKAEVLSA